MYSILLVGLLGGASENPHWHLRKHYAVNESGGYVYGHGVYGGGYGASFNYGPYYETGFGYSYFGTCYGNYYGPYLKDPVYSTPPGAIPRVPPQKPTLQEMVPQQPDLLPTPKTSRGNGGRLLIEVPEQASLKVNGQNVDVKHGIAIVPAGDIPAGKSKVFEIRMEGLASGKAIQKNKRVVLESGERASISFVEDSVEGFVAK